MNKHFFIIKKKKKIIIIIISIKIIIIIIKEFSPESLKGKTLHNSPAVPKEPFSGSL